MSQTKALQYFQTKAPVLLPDVGTCSD